MKKCAANPECPVTFICTNSTDLTTDLIISKLGTEKIFRFNLDQWRDFKFIIRPDDFYFENPAGISVSRENAVKFYWRRPLTKAQLFPERKLSEECQYADNEVSYTMRNLFNLAMKWQKVVLVEPFADYRVGKLIQMTVAANYFNVPHWAVFCGDWENPLGNGAMIVKSLTSSRLEDAKMLYATKINIHELDRDLLWFTQKYVNAAKDVTVVFVRGELFAFELDRSAFLDETVDWRESKADIGIDLWKPHKLPMNMQRNILYFMKDISLDFGRLDFLLSKEKGYYFLEVNPNGEWAWLDFDGIHGLLNRILSELSPDTLIHTLQKD